MTNRDLQVTTMPLEIISFVIHLRYSLLFMHVSLQIYTNLKIWYAIITSYCTVLRTLYPEV